MEEQARNILAYTLVLAWLLFEAFCASIDALKRRGSRRSRGSAPRPAAGQPAGERRGFKEPPPKR